jgi:hypothetical protein
MERAATVRPLGRRRLVDALAEWGLHEWRGRLARPALSADQATLTGVNTALWYRAPLVAAMLSVSPLEHCLQVEFDVEEARHLHIADGRRLETWTDAILVSSDDVWVRDRVPDPTPVVGPLICTGRFAPEGFAVPVIIFDGWHRAAVWVAHGRAGNRYAMRADIFVVQDEPPLLGGNSLQP